MARHSERASQRGLLKGLAGTVSVGACLRLIAIALVVCWLAPQEEDCQKLFRAIDNGGDGRITRYSATLFSGSECSPSRSFVLTGWVPVAEHAIASAVVWCCFATACLN